MVNKPGVLTQILAQLANTKVNILALTVTDSAEHGVLRVVAMAQDNIRKAMKEINMQFSETDVLCVTIANKSGAFAAITEKLAKAHINISYAYCTAGARGGRTIAVLKVANIKKTMQVLKGSSEPARAKSQPTTRRSPASKNR